MSCVVTRVIPPKPTPSPISARTIPPICPEDQVGPLDNFSATTDPTINDDSTAGYQVGSHWVNTLTGEAFLLVDSTAGGATWLSTTGTVTGFTGIFKYESFQASSFTYNSGDNTSSITLSAAPSVTTQLKDFHTLSRNGNRELERVTVTPTSKDQWRTIGNTLIVFGNILASGDSYEITYVVD